MTERIYAFIIGAAIAFVLCISTMVLIGYILGLPELRAWQGYSEMSLSSAVCIFQISIVLSYLAYKEFTRNS